VDRLSHELGHSYQSRITGPLYLFKYGIPSASNNKLSEPDANRRAGDNYLTLKAWRSQGKNRVKWWELGFGSLLWPFMWSWN